MKTAFSKGENMSRIKEGLVLKTDKERLEWFQALSSAEQTEVVKEAREIVDHLIEAFRSINPLLLEAAAMSG